MATPWTGGPYVFPAEGGQSNLVVIPAPYRGSIRSIRMAQVEGGSVATKFRLFKSKDAAYAITGVSESESLEALTPDIYEIGPPQQFASGATLRVDDVNYEYENADGVPGSRKFEIYMVVEPGGSGLKKFSLAITVDQPLVV